jgi:hypothetical protein
MDPPQHAFDPRQQLAQMKRLRQVIIGAHFEPDDAVNGFAPAGQDDDADARLLVAQRPRQGQTVLAGQHQIENHEVDLGLAEHAAHAGTLMCRGDPIPLAGEVFLDDVADLLLIVYDENVTVVAHRAETRSNLGFTTCSSEE